MARLQLCYSQACSQNSAMEGGELLRGLLLLQRLKILQFLQK